MSSLPEIDHLKVSQRLASTISEKTLHVLQLEVLAETLRDERDEARSELAQVTADRDDLLIRLSPKDENTDGV